MTNENFLRKMGNKNDAYNCNLKERFIMWKLGLASNLCNSLTEQGLEGIVRSQILFRATKDKKL